MAELHVEPKKHNNMNISWLWIAVVLIIIAIAAYFLLNNDNKTDNVNETQRTNTTSYLQPAQPDLQENFATT